MNFLVLYFSHSLRGQEENAYICSAEKNRAILVSERKYANDPVVSDFLELFDPHPWCGKAGDSKANHAQCPLFSSQARA